MSKTYVLDTQTLAWFVKGTYVRLGEAAFLSLIERFARIVVPAYAIQEMQDNFALKREDDKNVKIPPSGIVRVLLCCANIRILARGATVLKCEYSLRKKVDGKRLDIDRQNIPIAAALLVVRHSVSGDVALITSDTKLQKWVRTATNINLIASGS